MDPKMATFFLLHGWIRHFINLMIICSFHEKNGTYLSSGHHSLAVLLLEKKIGTILGIKIYTSIGRQHMDYGQSVLSCLTTKRLTTSRFNKVHKTTE